MKLVGKLLALDERHKAEKNLQRGQERIKKLEHVADTRLEELLEDLREQRLNGSTR